jgi:competence protein ComEA
MKQALAFRTALAALALTAGGLAVHAQKTTPAPAATMAVDCTAALKAKVNLNTAKTDELECLKGIGPKIAADIVKNRPYKDGKDLQDKVKGIGPKTWADIKGFVSFK